MKILFVTSSLFPYRVNWLDELGKNAEIDIYYLMDDDEARNREWCAKRPQNCTYALMKSFKLPKLGLISFDFIKLLKKQKSEYDIIILDGYGFTTQLINIYYLNSRKIVYYVNIDGMVLNNNEYRLISFIKKKIISKIPYFLCGAKPTNKFLIHYGAKPDHIFNHPFTSLYNKDIFLSQITQYDKLAIRKKLGISEKNVIISVGRFSYMNGYGKGYDTLMRAAQHLDKDCGVYIIGDEPTEEFVNMKNSMKLENVHFIGFKNPEELKKYYMAADLFVLMTVYDVWGLVINEAMAHGLPVITTDMCVAGLELIENGKNGYIIPVGDDTALVDRIKKIIYNKDLMEDMSKNNLMKIRDYTIEKMAKTHIEIFNTVLTKKE